MLCQDPDSHRITDFFSFYTLPSTALRSNPQQTINAAYLFYMASAACPNCSALLPAASSQGPPSATSWDKETSEDRKKLKDRLNLLVQDALILAARVSLAL
jgi:glycylpeptide N-tetradecanoyltransferase